MDQSTAASRIFCAIDTPDRTQARALAASLAGVIGGIKLGLEFFIAHGPAGVEAVIADSGLPLFLDLKLHDIPNTVAGAVRSAVALRPTFLTLHTSGGTAMMRAAVEAATEEADKTGLPRPRLLGVTVLTSLDHTDLVAIGLTTVMPDQVKLLAALARAAGLDGVVCSPDEVAGLRALCGPDFTLMVPGIRPAGATTFDQKRVKTPAAAVAAGADHLVIGRPITREPDPAAAARRIVAELMAAAGGTAEGRS